VQRIWDVCQAYAESHGIIFNCNKTVCITFKAKSATSTGTPLLTLGGQNVKSVNKHKYLGIVFDIELSDDNDIQRQLWYQYCAANKLRVSHLFFYVLNSSIHNIKFSQNQTHWVHKSDLTQMNWHDAISQITQYHRYYHSVVYTAIKIETVLNKVNSDKLQLNFIYYFLNVPQIKCNIITSD